MFSFCLAECPPLGMESHKVEPDQLSASSMSQYHFAPQRARLNMQVHNNQGGAMHLQAGLEITTSCQQHWKILLLLGLSLPGAALVVHAWRILLSPQYLNQQCVFVGGWGYPNSSVNGCKSRYVALALKILKGFEYSVACVSQGSDDEENIRGGAWCANSEDAIHWFEIDARRATEFTGVITQGRDSLNE